MAAVLLTPSWQLHGPTVDIYASDTWAGSGMWGCCETIVAFNVCNVSYLQSPSYYTAVQHNSA
jgi:hypothetical protein